MVSSDCAPDGVAATSCVPTTFEVEYHEYEATSRSRAGAAGFTDRLTYHELQEGRVSKKAKASEEAKIEKQVARLKQKEKSAGCYRAYDSKPSSAFKTSADFKTPTDFNSDDLKSRYSY